MFVTGVFGAAEKFKRSLRKIDSKGNDSPDGPSEIPPYAICVSANNAQEVFTLLLSSSHVYLSVHP